MASTTFIKEGPDKKGRIYIIEGEKKPQNIFSVKRFICEIQEQQDEKATQEVADLVLNALKTYKSKS